MSGPACYYPDRSIATNHTSCNAGAAQSWCCAPDSICLDNGYCLQTSSPNSNRLGRHSCTDKYWSPQACPSYCADSKSYGTTSVFLVSDESNGAFCCTQNVNTTTGQCQVSTNGSKAPFYLPIGKVIYNRTNGATITGPTLTRDDLLAGGIDLSASQTPYSSPPAPSCGSPVLSIVLSTTLIVLFILSLSGCCWFGWQNRKLKKERSAWLGQARAAPAVARKSPQATVSPVSDPAETATTSPAIHMDELSKQTYR